MKDLCESLVRVEKNPMEPFSFLKNITGDINDTKTLKSNSVDQVSNSTKIDIEMATLLQRIQLNKSLLEQANDGVKMFNSLIKKKIEENESTNISSCVLSEENYSSIDEMQRIFKLTIGNLNKVKDNSHC
ncbi:hypothetical protein PV327_009920 [Microctonus hyperodae]|uniref:Uncharacterized protein n=1 Tax=Microctonus hyperodae TaxID=165561 RepID=A0AA39F1Z7_MICHY|nr:hypothetical protein PV327_009920 [Microctonus hyperodae]